MDDDRLPDHIARAFRDAPGRILTTAELRRMHVPRRWVLALVELGLLERLIYGVYRDPAAPVPADQCLHVALAYLRQRRPAHCLPDVLDGAGALAAQRAEGFAPPGRAFVLIESCRHIRVPRDLFDVRRVDLSRVAAEDVGGLRVTEAERALAVAAADGQTTDKAIRLAVQDLRRRGGLDVVGAVTRWGARSGAGPARLVEMARAGQFDQESEGEREAFLSLFTENPPMPDCQVWLTPGIRVDFIFIAAGLIIEYLGEDWHKGSVQADTSRAWAVRTLGFDSIAVVRSMVRDRVSKVALAQHIHAIRLEREALIASGAIRRPVVPPQPARLTPLRTVA